MTANEPQNSRDNNDPQHRMDHDPQHRSYHHDDHGDEHIYQHDDIHTPPPPAAPRKSAKLSAGHPRTRSLGPTGRTFANIELHIPRPTVALMATQAVLSFGIPFAVIPLVALTPTDGSWAPTPPIPRPPIPRPPSSAPVSRCPRSPQRRPSRPDRLIPTKENAIEMRSPC